MYLVAAQKVSFMKILNITTLLLGVVLTALLSGYLDAKSASRKLAKARVIFKPEAIIPNVGLETSL
jgi:hypothetical protein